jgi:arylsulfatase A-like enzyme
MFYRGTNPTDPSNRSLDALDSQPLGPFWRENWLDKLMPGLTDIEYVVALYDAEIRYVDEAVGEVLDAVENCGIANDTLVIVTSDHGESLVEHNILFEHHGLYQTCVHVPFVCRWPAGGIHGGRRLDIAADHRDIAPTVLDAAGAPIPEPMEGRSLLPLLRGEACRGDFANRSEPLVLEECTWQAKWAILADGYKLIVARGPDVQGMPPLELYHLQSDPGEIRNLASERPNVALNLLTALEEWIAQRVARHRLSGDPLVVQGITLGKRWREKTLFSS